MYSVAFKNTLQAMREDSVYSPDVYKLQKKYVWVPVFVYGAEKKNFFYHKQMNDYPRMGVGRTVQGNFDMFSTQKGHVIALQRGAFHFPSGGNYGLGHIKGEIYLVPPAQIFDMDIDYENTCYYERVKRDIIWSEENKSKFSVTSCYMYLGDWEMFQSCRGSAGLRNNTLVVPDAGRPYYEYTKIQDFSLHSTEES